MDFISSWANAIAQFEGFGQAGSRPTRNHNPGDLKYAGQPGAVGQDPQGFAVFPDDGTGFQALGRQLTKYVNDFPDDTILDITAHYLGQHTATSDSQGNAFHYANFVASSLGVPVTTTLATLATGSAGDTTDTSATSPESSSGDSSSSSGPDNGGILALVTIGGLLFWVVTRVLR